MLVRGIEPDVFTFNTLINAYCKGGNVKLAYQLLDVMSAEGWNPDLVSYTSLIAGFSELCDFETAISCVYRMIDEGIPQTHPHGTF